MATEWISPTWRMPQESNQSKVDNYSLSLDGSTEYMTIPSTNFGDASTNVSYSLWLKPNMPGGASNYGYLLSGASSSDGGLAMNEGGSGAGGVNGTFYYYDGSTVSVLTSTPLTAGNWAHLVFIFDASANEVYAYINGSLDKTTSVTAPFKTTFTTLFRYTPATTHYYDGQAAEICIYNYTITSSQVTALYNSGTPVNPMAISGQLPVAYYPLGESSTGNATTLTIPNESVPSATVFDSNVTGYIVTKTGAEFDISTKFSFSLWANLQTLITYRHLIGASDANWLEGFGLYISSFKLQFWVDQYNGAGKYVTTDNNLSTDKWYHIACTFDNTNGGLMYIDGVAQNSGTAFTGATLGAVDLNKIIRIFGTTSGWIADAFMSNAQIWNTELSASEVTTLYNNGVPLLTGTQPQAANLKAWYKLNVDSSTWDGSNWIISNSTANYTTALDFPGGTDYIDCTNGFPTTLGASATAVTVSGWVKITDLAQQQCLFNITTPGGNYYGDFSIWYHSSSNELQGYIDSNSNNIKLTSGITDNKWHHLALVYDQSAGATITDGLKLYLDGSLVTPTSSAGSTPASVDFTASGGMTTRLGWGWSNTYTAVAEMSNWAMWNSALTAGNITTLYNDGTPETTISLSPTSYYKLDNTTTGIQDSGSASNNGTITGSITQVDSFVSTLNGLSVSMTTANLINSDLTRSIPYSSYSMDFDGTDDKITLSSGVSTGNNYSVSFWLNPDNVAAGNSYIFSDSTGSPWEGLALDQGSSSAGGPGNFYYYNGSVNVVNTTAISLGSWSHIVITLDVTGQEIKFYINGSLDKTTTSVANIGTLIDEFGTRDAGNYFNGKLSNISIFTTLLSQDQILTIYNGGVPNSISNLSPVGWWSLAGDSYYNGTNWICPDLGSGGNNGTSSGMGGTEIVGNGPGSTANTTATNMAIPANLKGDSPNSTKNAFSVNMTAVDRIDYDADAKAFINAAGITDATQQLAITTLVSSLQNDNLWTNMKAIYPMVGGTATTHMYNLKDPQDTDAAFRLTFAGGWTHSTTGATPNGTNAGGDTHFIPNDQFSSFNAMSFGYYSRETSDASSLGYDMGVYQAAKTTGFLIQYANKFYYSLNQTTYETPANTHTDGFFVANRSGASAIEGYRNGSSIDTGTDTSAVSAATVSMQVGRFGGGNYWGNKECAFAFIYDGSLDATQNLNLYNAVQAFNTTLGRQV